MRHFLTTFLLLPTLLLAQHPDAVPGASGPASAVGLPTALPTTTPLLASSAEADGVLWAAAPTYKVAFANGLRFCPWLPDQPHTQAFEWHTEALRTGDGERAVGEAQRQHAARQCRFEYAGLTEVYDLSENGVEQSFVIAAAPQQPGAIAVRGRISGSLRAAPCAAAVGALAFATADGTAAMTYGAALVRDAVGHEASVTTAFDGECITLEVAAGFVATATFPITIDPLTAAVAVGTGMPVTDTAIAASSTTGDHAVLVACVRQFSATDRDAYAYTIADDGSAAPLLVFIDLSTVDTPRLDAADVGAPAMWLLAIERSPATGQTITVYRQTQSNPVTLGWSSTVLPFAAAGNRNPALGGRDQGSLALLVFETAVTANTATLGGAVFDAATGALAPAFSLTGAAGASAVRQPAVTRSVGGSEPWRVLWSEDSGNNVDFFVRGNVVNSAGAIGVAQSLVLGTDAREPRLDGGSGRYVMTWLDTPSGTNGRLHARRFDWSAAGAITNVHDRTLATAATLPVQSIAQGGVAYDAVTQSHWAVTWRSSQILLSSTTSATIVRLGHSGGVVDTAVLHPSGADGVALPVVAFDGRPQVGQAEGFVTACALNNSNGTVNFRRYEYAPPSTNAYGTSCRTNAIGDGHPPYAGSEFYRTAVLGLPAGTPALWLFGTTPANVALDGLGMFGCSLLVNYVVVLGTVADGTGLAQMTIALPDDPVYLGDFYSQWAWFEPAANPFGFVTSRGFHVLVQ